MGPLRSVGSPFRAIAEVPPRFVKGSMKQKLKANTEVDKGQTELTGLPVPRVAANSGSLLCSLGNATMPLFVSLLILWEELPSAGRVKWREDPLGVGWGGAWTRHRPSPGQGRAGLCCV